MTGRVSRKDWAAAGLRVLREEGPEALTVERLCTRLKRTKGSFYHHFVDVAALHHAVLEEWERELTQGPIEASRAEPRPARRGARLDAVVGELDHRLDRMVRAWGLRDGLVQLAVERVDALRIGYLEELYRGAGRRAPRALAELEYATFVGAQHLGVLDDPKRAAALSRRLRAALGTHD